MLNRIVKSVVQAMSGTLTSEQLQKLQNVLYINFQGTKVTKDETEIVPLDSNNDTQKLKLFRMSKLVSGRQESTLKQYIREIVKCRNVINKNFEDITSNDLRCYFAILRERDKISMRTLQSRRRYLNSFWEFLKNEGFVKSNPIKSIESFKTDSKLKQSFSGKELTDLRASCNDIREVALLEFLYATGLRVSELC